MIFLYLQLHLKVFTNVLAYHVQISSVSKINTTKANKTVFLKNSYNLSFLISPFFKTEFFKGINLELKIFYRKIKLEFKKVLIRMDNNVLQSCYSFLEEVADRFDYREYFLLGYKFSQDKNNLAQMRKVQNIIYLYNVFLLQIADLLTEIRLMCDSCILTA